MQGRLTTPELLKAIAGMPPLTGHTTPPAWRSSQPGRSRDRAAQRDRATGAVPESHCEPTTQRTTLTTTQTTTTQTTTQATTQTTARRTTRTTAQTATSRTTLRTTQTTPGRRRDDAGATTHRTTHRTTTTGRMAEQTSTTTQPHTGDGAAAPAMSGSPAHNSTSLGSPSRPHAGCAPPPGRWDTPTSAIKRSAPPCRWCSTSPKAPHAMEVRAPTTTASPTVQPRRGHAVLYLVDLPGAPDTPHRLRRIGGHRARRRRPATVPHPRVLARLVRRRRRAQPSPGARHPINTRDIGVIALGMLAQSTRRPAACRR